MIAPLPSERFAWIQRVREYQARQERIRALRAELAECRRIGKERRHAERLRRAKRQ